MCIRDRRKLAAGAACLSGSVCAVGVRQSKQYSGEYFNAAVQTGEPPHRPGQIVPAQGAQQPLEGGLVEAAGEIHLLKLGLHLLDGHKHLIGAGGKALPLLEICLLYTSAQRIYNLLDELRQDEDKTYLLVAHNLSLIHI